MKQKQRNTPHTAESLMERVQTLDSGCWLWLGNYSGGRKREYGRVRFDGKPRPAHIAFYLAFVGPVPEGLEIDHTCCNPGCVNPAHLEPVTHKVNTLRGSGPTAVNARVTHCPYGHPYAGDNLYTDPRGQRHCRACSNVRNANYRRRKAEQRKEARQMEPLFVGLVMLGAMWLGARRPTLSLSVGRVVKAPTVPVQWGEEVVG